VPAIRTAATIRMRMVRCGMISPQARCAIVGHHPAPRTFPGRKAGNRKLRHAGSTTVLAK
jgi:hypothetical protein